ncbi:hypothetical protein GGQ64_002729 [Rhizobium azooxidifex]|uniref:DoxX family protein n=1 Tax=Mycoplana azooxidifex TaxID=1636188 RepID=A0A7W6GJU9_9HYPH|nr:DUF6790 family protein [Mycoplana azooxidifex]MBB3977523.1 hypothetical protein [Mycoplana azooxidifex]
MYLLMLLALMVVLPIVSILIEQVSGTDASLLFLIGKWFVFWIVGVRLLLAGVRQVMQPSYTATKIFQIKDPEAEKLVTEIGFGNLAMGLVGVLTLLEPAWVVPAGLTGGLYLGLAGVKHAMNADRSRAENIAMATDFFGAAVIAVGVIARLA